MSSGLSEFCACAAEIGIRVNAATIDQMDNRENGLSNLFNGVTPSCY